MDTTVICGLCGLERELTDETGETWHLEAWVIYEDGKEVEVSPTCPSHDSHGAPDALDGGIYLYTQDAFPAQS